MKSLIRAGIISAVSVFVTVSLACAIEVELEKIVVTPSGMEESYESSSQTVEVITAKDIESTNAKDLASVLTDINSVTISDQGGVGQNKSIRMRGSTSAQVLVLVDGRPINNPRDGSVDLRTIPLDNISRVEVVHGPGSSLYGSSAMAGTVNIITKSPPKDKPETRLYSSFGTFKTYTEQFSHGARVANLGYLISGGYISSEGFRTNSEFNQKDFNAKFEYKLNNYNDLSVNAGFYKSRAGAPGSIFYPDIDDKQVTLKNFIDLNWIFRPDALTQAKAKFYNNYERLELNPNSLDNPFFEFSTAKSVHATQVRGINMQGYRQVFEKYRLSAGMDYIANFNDSTDTAKHKYTVLAWFAENQLELSKDLKLNLNARVDNYSNFGAQFDPSFSVVYNLNEKNKLRGLISRSFRAPTFNDLYWSSPGMIGNPNLKPEKGLTGEVGIETRLNKKTLVELTYYKSKYKELIQWAPLTADQFSDWTVKNIGTAIIDGIELSNKISLTDNLEADVGYSFLVARDDKTHKFLVYQPENKADLALKYSGLNGFSFEIRGQYNDKRFGDPNNTLKVKRYFFINLNASKKFKSGFTYTFSIDNLLGDKYQVISGYPVQGFSLTNSIKYEF